MKIRNHSKKNITLKRIKKHQKYDDDVTFIILCDTPGYRMKSYGPSCLLQIGRQRLIDYQISIIKEFFINAEILICLGFESELVIKYIYQNNQKIKIIENQLFEQYYSCESIRLALNVASNNKIFILDGSLLLSKDIFNDLYLSDNILFYQKEQDNFEVSFNINEKKIVEYMSFGAATIWTEIVYITDDAIHNLKYMLSSGNYKNKFIFEAINELIKLKTEFKPHKLKKNIHKINNIKSYNEIRNKK